MPGETGPGPARQASGGGHPDVDGYVFVQGWAKLPPGLEMGEVAGVGVDAADRVYAFNRGDHPMIVFDPDGSCIGSWGESVFSRPHGLHIGHDGALYCTDEGDHTVRKFTPEGELLMTIGIPGSPSAVMSGAPFNKCTHTALSPQSDIYVSDGYANACIHKFSAAGELRFSWGRSGCLPGEFFLPHNICCDSSGLVYVADRENHRIQIFTEAGAYLDQWNNMQRPCAMFLKHDQDRIYVGEVGPLIDRRHPYHNLGPRLSIFDLGGALLARIGEGNAGTDAGQFIAPHGIAVDSLGDIYVADVACTAWPLLFPDRERPGDLPTLRKLKKRNAGSGSA